MPIIVLWNLFFFVPEPTYYTMEKVVCLPPSDVNIGGHVGGHDLLTREFSRYNESTQPCPPLDVNNAEFINLKPSWTDAVLIKISRH